MSQPSLPARIGKYEVLKPLAVGGMAELFLARATGLVGIERLVVIKRVRPQLATYPKYISMFLDEARLAANLQHANIVQTYDFGEDYGGYFFAMEYLHGEDVARIMKTVMARGERMPLENAVGIAIGMCAGLHYAHERVALDGQPLYIVHRDVSPHNVAVTYDGGVKVVDFGIAKAARRLIETRNRTIKGKIPYMSPEQCLGGQIDRRSDVFSISIVLWELTMGRRLFDPKSPLGLLKAVSSADVPRPTSLVADYPAELEAIVMKGPSPEVIDRFQTAEELQLALESFARERKLPVSPVSLSRYMRDLFLPTVEAFRQAQLGGAPAMTGFVLDDLARRSDRSDSGTYTSVTDDDARDEVQAAWAQEGDTQVLAEPPRKSFDDEQEATPSDRLAQQQAAQRMPVLQADRTKTTPTPAPPPLRPGEQTETAFELPAPSRHSHAAHAQGERTETAMELVGGVMEPTRLSRRAPRARSPWARLWLALRRLFTGS